MGLPSVFPSCTGSLLIESGGIKLRDGMLSTKSG